MSAFFRVICLGYLRTMSPTLWTDFFKKCEGCLPAFILKTTRGLKYLTRLPREGVRKGSKRPFNEVSLELQGQSERNDSQGRTGLDRLVSRSSIPSLLPEHRRP